MGTFIETKLYDKRGLVGTVEDSGSEGPGRFLACQWRRDGVGYTAQLGFDCPVEAERWLQSVYEEWLTSRQSRVRGALWSDWLAIGRQRR